MVFIVILSDGKLSFHVASLLFYVVANFHIRILPSLLFYNEICFLINKLQEMEHFQEIRFEELLKGTLDTNHQLQDQFMNVKEINETWFT